MRARRGIGAVLLATALIAACGDDTTDGDSASATTVPANGADTTTAAGDPATGDPVNIHVIFDEMEDAGGSFDTPRAGLEARVRRVNAEGGLGGSGRPVELVYCISAADPNRTADCARAAVDDPDAIAIAGTVINGGDAVNPLLEQAGMANIGSAAFSASDGTSPVSFPTMSGLIGATGCQASVLVDEAGSTAPGVIYLSLPAAELSVGLASATLETRGLELAADVQVAITQPDVSAEVASALAESDALITASDGGTARKVIRAARQQGSDVPIAGSGAQTFTPENIAGMGADAEGIYLALWYATDDTPGEGIDQYLADMEAAGTPDLSDDLAKMGWIAIELADQAARSATSVDRAGLLAALTATTEFDTGGLTPILDFTQPGSFIDGAQPRIVNTTCVYGQISDGEVVGLGGGFVNPFEPLD